MVEVGEWPMLKLQFCRNTMEHMDLRRHFSKVVQVRVYIIETVPKVRSTTEGPPNANQGGATDRQNVSILAGVR